MAGFKFGKRSEENLKGVHPSLVSVVRRALELSKQDFTVIEGLRTFERQRELMKQGATRTMNSRHLKGYAVDLMPYGVPHVWETGRKDVLQAWHDIADAMKQAAAEKGAPVEWGGDWRSFVDMPHYELSRTKYL